MSPWRAGRRIAAGLLVLAGLAWGAATAVAQRGPANQAVALRGVADVGMTVADLDRSVEFYTGVLGFVAEREAEVTGEAYERLTGVFGVRLRIAILRLGAERLELTQYLAPEGRPYPVDTRSNDRWFQHVAIVVRDMDRAYRHLRQHRVRHASTGPQRLPAANPNAGGIEAFYFRDPDGHHLEVIAFPEGKGDPRWRRAGGDLFLGIDHTAIVVADTEASLRFYRDLLGFEVAGQSRNYGPEQARLNNVEGASLLITGLRLGEGPGVELLEYLVPRDGRPYPADARANDLVHWQTTLAAPAGGASLDLVATWGIPLVSRGAVTVPDDGLGFRRAVIVRDPDGHAVRVAEP